MKEDLINFLGTDQDSSDKNLIIAPYKLLKINQGTDQYKLKFIFQNEISQKHLKERQMISIAYELIMFNEKKEKNDYYEKINDELFQVKIKDVFYYAITGNFHYLQQIIQSQPQKYISMADQYQRSLIYICSRGGHYWCVKLLLCNGFNINMQQSNKSTALHAASFFGHKHLILLLKDFGADTDIKNQWGNKPSDEAYNDQIKNTILDKTDNINIVFQECVKENIATNIKLLVDKKNKKIIGKRLDRQFYDAKSNTYKSFIEIMPELNDPNQFTKCYHGTKQQYLASILKHGLKEPGQKTDDGHTIQVQKNHFQLGKEHYGQQNWAQAIFVSPSLFYASDAVYAERIQDQENKQYCCLVEGYVRKDSFKSQKGAGNGTYQPLPNEPSQNEYQIKEKAEIYRIDDKGKNLFITSILFVKLQFLENCQDYNNWIECSQKDTFDLSQISEALDYYWEYEVSKIKTKK